MKFSIGVYFVRPIVNLMQPVWWEGHSSLWGAAVEIFVTN